MAIRVSLCVNLLRNSSPTKNIRLLPPHFSHSASLRVKCSVILRLRVLAAQCSHRLLLVNCRFRMFVCLFGCLVGYVFVCLFE